MTPIAPSDAVALFESIDATGSALLALAMSFDRLVNQLRSIVVAQYDFDTGNISNVLPETTTIH